ncbi:MAG: hypothetical protein KGQ51_04310 [Planctomycetes bacterium]|nr:hypothetical protein [Planctomycetota bacterium]
MENSTQTDPLRQTDHQETGTHLAERHAAKATLAILVAGAILAIALRWLSFHFASGILATTAAMLLFAPASFATVALGWGKPMRFRLAFLAFALFLLTFLLWNNVMLPGLSKENAIRAFKQNMLHWTLYLFFGILSLRFVQWTTGMGIASEPVCDEPTGLRSSQISLAKILAIAAACAVGAETARRLMNLPGRDTALYLHGILGGSLLGIQWSVLFWLLRWRSWRIAGLILWIAIAAIIRWTTDTIVDQFTDLLLVRKEVKNLDDLYYIVVVVSSRTPLMTLGQAMQFLWQASLQTAIILGGIASFRGLGYPIQYLHSKR